MSFKMILHQFKRTTSCMDLRRDLGYTVLPSKAAMRAHERSVGLKGTKAVFA